MAAAPPPAEPVTTDHDVVIVGAGVAGCTLAHSFARDGRKVLLIERDLSEPDRIVGELMQPSGILALQKLGLESTVEGIDAIPTYGYEVVWPADGSGAVIEGKDGKPIGGVHLPYGEVRQPAAGVAFHHGRFIMNLRRAAAAAKGVTVVEGTATELLEDGPEGADVVVGVAYNVRSAGADGEAAAASTERRHARAPLTIACDGCFSRFRRAAGIVQPVVGSHFVGLVLRDCALPRRQHGNVVLAQPAPVLLYQIGTRDTRILVDIIGPLPSQADGALARHLRTVVAPQLPDSTQKCLLQALDEGQRIRVMPNGYLPPVPNRRPGLIVVGDALNMRHPLTGGGMTVCLWDVVHLRELLHPTLVPDFSDAPLVARAARALHARRRPLASVVNVLALALHALFAAGDDASLRALRDACFAYFLRGGACADTPVALLSGLCPSPATLAYHFFAVAALAAWRIATSPKGGIVGFPAAVARAIAALWTACVVFLPLVYKELR
ncbi:Squalene epoxidase, partial [Cladochytrium tenue]